MSNAEWSTRGNGLISGSEGSKNGGIHLAKEHIIDPRKERIE